MHPRRCLGMIFSTKIGFPIPEHVYEQLQQDESPVTNCGFQCGFSRNFYHFIGPLVLVSCSQE